jgi:hypothetical protein
MLFARYTDVLLSLFSDIQSLKQSPNDAQLCLKIQEELIVCISNAERRISSLKKSVIQRKRDLRSRHSDRQRSRRLKQKITELVGRIEEYRLFTCVLRDVGDAIAFAYIDRWDIKPLSLKAEAGFLTGKKGSRLERATLREVFRRGGIAILNDLTHSLRYGDITVLSESGFFIIECKSGGGSFDRFERQARSADSVMSYLRTDSTEGLADQNIPLRRFETHATLRTHLSELNKLLEVADSEFLMREVERGQHYIVARSLPPDRLNEAFAKFNRSPLTICFLNDLKFNQYAFSPFTLSLANPKRLLDFYRGEFVVMIAIDFDVVVEQFAAHGLVVARTEDEEHWPWSIADSKTNDEHIRVGRYMMTRMYAEFISLQWFVDEVAHRARFAVEWRQSEGNSGEVG